MAALRAGGFLALPASRSESGPITAKDGLLGSYHTVIGVPVR
jgi:hypothetical protein